MVHFGKDNTMKIIKESLVSRDKKLRKVNKNNICRAVKKYYVILQ
jgi:hypothetical protein